MRIAPCADVCYKAPVLPQRIASIVGVCLLATACSGVTPANPSGVIAPIALDLETAPSASPSTVQRVEEGGGGGGGQCLVVPGIVCGDIVLSAGDALMVGVSSVRRTTNPLEFTVTAGLAALSGTYGQSGNPGITGHFPNATIQMTVANGVASTALTLLGLNDQASFNAAGTAPAIQSVDPCISGKKALVTTRVTLDLQYLGKTAITERHDRDCGA